MFAIVEAGGRQWKVEPGTRLDINRVTTDVGATHTLERVLLGHDGQQLQIGRPYIEGAAVLCEVLEHRKGPKVISYYFRRRENWRKTIGHRQPLTRLIVKDVRFPGLEVKPESTAKAKTPAVARKAAAQAKVPTVKAKVSITKRPTRKPSSPRPTDVGRGQPTE